MVNVKARIQTWRFNAMPNQDLGVWNLRFNGRDQIVRSGNYGYSSMRVASIDENKNSHQKITNTYTQTTCPNCITLHAGKKGVRPAEVGDPVSIFEKSTTKLKLKQKLLKCKRTILMVTFNVRTLNRIRQLLKQTGWAIDHNIEIICIQEHRFTHSEDIKYHDTGNGWTLVTESAWKSSFNATIGGIGMLIGPRFLKSLNSIEERQPRMTVATFNAKPTATIISGYSPTNVSEENYLIAFNIIIMIILSGRWHGYPWPSLATSPYL